MTWTPFIYATKPLPTIKQLKRDFKVSKEQAKYLIEQQKRATIVINNLYEVEIRQCEEQPNWPKMIWLSIKRRDKESIHDWRDLQRIKNELVGPENEAVELYPAESRIVDTSNQYHLWVLADKDLSFPFGFNDGRLVATPEDIAHTKAKQRPFEDK